MKELSLRVTLWDNATGDFQVYDSDGLRVGEIAAHLIRTALGRRFVTGKKPRVVVLTIRPETKGMR